MSREIILIEKLSDKLCGVLGLDTGGEDWYERRVTFKVNRFVSGFLADIKASAFFYRVECDIVKLHSGLLRTQYGVSLRGGKEYVEAAEKVIVEQWQ